MKQKKFYVKESPKYAVNGCVTRHNEHIKKTQFDHDNMSLNLLFTINRQKFNEKKSFVYVIYIYFIYFLHAFIDIFSVYTNLMIMP